MEPPVRWISSRRLGAGVLLAGGAYAVLASFTTPFTLGADLVTALPIGFAAVVFGLRMRWPRRSPGIPAGSPAQPATSTGRWSLVWLGAAGLVLGWELFVYSQTPRHLHPTLSTLIDTVDDGHAGKSLMFALWLVLGWYLLQ
jgi:hypothetical protein